MTNAYIGSSIPRFEDERLLTGRALYVGDIERPNMLHAHFVRSPFPSARIVSIDAEAARAHPGVAAVYTSADLGDFNAEPPVVVPPPPIEGLVFNKRTHRPLAIDRVRYVGEPVAMVLADSRYSAEDAAALIAVEYEQLPSIVGLEEALKDDAVLVHEDLGTNVAARARQTKGDYETAAKDAHTIVRRRFTYDHGLALPIETRAILADWDVRADRLLIWATSQAPTFLKGALAGVLGMTERQIRVVAPFVGGGFGCKILMYYPEELLVPWASLRLERPVKWIEDRSESFVATTHERGQIHDAEMALDADGRIIGIRDEFLHDNGCYNPYGLTVPLNSQCSVLGNYVVPNYDSTITAIFTNKTLVAPVRGAGRQHGVFVIERLLDIAAREMGIDRAEMRRRNFIPADAFPWNNEITFQDFAALRYDSGNYQATWDKLLELVGYDHFIAEEQPRLRQEGKRVGLGVVSYVEGTGIGPYEGAKVRIEPGGRIHVATCIGTQGQSHFTTFAQIAADCLGVLPSDVDVVTGDTDQMGWGAGTFASRGIVVAGNAVNEAAEAVRDKALELGAKHLGCAPSELSLAEGNVIVTASPERRIGLDQVAQLANQMRGAVEPGAEPGLEAVRFFGPECGTTANGAHAVIVEVDPETMMIDIKRYVVVHDCGVLVNPMVVDGQVLGGLAHGIGDAFYEELLFDGTGQLLNATLADYLVPTALEVPHFELAHLETRSRTNKLGVKGVGEAGAIPVGAAFAQAVEDALGIEILDMPLSPDRLWSLAGASREAPTG